MLIFLALLSIIVNEYTSHSKIRDDRRMLLLWQKHFERSMFNSCSRTLTENSHITKLLVSLRLRSPVTCRPSPTLPPLPILRPALSFFFFAVLTLLKWISIFDGNWSAGRWKDRASCFDKRVLYYEQEWAEMTNTLQEAIKHTNGNCSFWAGYACSTTSWPKVCRTRWRPPSFDTS